VSERDPRDVIRIEELERENTALREELARVRGDLKELTRIVEELQKRARKDKRQAHLFRRESEKKDKKQAGRKLGHDGAFRERPDHVDESVEARLDGCPCCGGPVFDVEELLQYVIDLPEIRMHVLQILTERGWCRRCRKHVRSTHPRQVSKAGGAAAVAMGPKASALVVELKTRQGVPYRDIAELFSRYLNFPVTHGALVQATVRLADKATADYLNLVDEVRASPLVHSDETGWRIARRSAWLWVFCTDAVTIYLIDYRRSADVVLDVLGADFKGRLLSDGLPALDKLAKHGFLRAQCNGHIIRRCRELAAVTAGRASHFPRRLQETLQDAIALGKVREQLSPARYLEGVAEVRQTVRALAAGDYSDEENLKLAKHVHKHQDALLAFLEDATIPPTNNTAEHEIRGAVVLRKIGGCHRQEAHALAHSVLASHAQTAHRRGQRLDHLVANWMTPHATSDPKRPARTPSRLKR
jgi:transposase